MNGIRFVVLSDDHAQAPYVPEHGFALAIRFRDRNILFDTGQWAFAMNAERTGVDVSAFDDCVISHGHYDHTGGIGILAGKNRYVRIWAHKDVMMPHFRDADGFAKVLSIPEIDRRTLKGLPVHRLRLVDAPMTIAPGAGLVCPIPRIHPLEDTGGRFFLDKNLSIIDPIGDELALWIEHEKGLVIVTGCCHAGFINTCEAAKSAAGIGHIHAVIGGFHLQSATDERIRTTCDYISSEGISIVVPCHCTGQDAVEKMRARLSGVVRDGRCGEAFAV